MAKEFEYTYDDKATTRDKLALPKAQWPKFTRKDYRAKRTRLTADWGKPKKVDKPSLWRRIVDSKKTPKKETVSGKTNIEKQYQKRLGRVEEVEKQINKKLTNTMNAYGWGRTKTRTEQASHIAKIKREFAESERKRRTARARRSKK